MKQFIVDKATKILKFGIVIDYEVYSDELLIETDLTPTFVLNLWNGENWQEAATEEEIAEFHKSKIKKVISRAEFMYGLDLQGVKEEDGEVIYFIKNFIEDLDIKRKAKNLFLFATEFEHFNTMLQAFFPAFNQYLQAIGKEPIIFDDIFIRGIELND